MDPATGELTGVIKDYVELAKDCLQGQTLEFDLKGYDTRNEQLQALHTREIDLIFHVSQNPYSAETNGFVLSDTIWTFNMAATTAKDSFNENAENTVAVTKDNFALKAYNDSQCLCGRYAKMPGCRYECLSCQTVGGPESHCCHCTGL